MRLVVQLATVRFNPCFNGQQDKNHKDTHKDTHKDIVSILVLMDSRIKIAHRIVDRYGNMRFNPCFNGQQDKNSMRLLLIVCELACFNPCFNGQQDKNRAVVNVLQAIAAVSILVLMDSRIKIVGSNPFRIDAGSFNPCFNGQQDKNIRGR